MAEIVTRANDERNGKERYYYYHSLEGLLKSLAKKLPVSELKKVDIEPDELLNKLTDGYKEISRLIKQSSELVGVEELVACQRELQQCKEELQKFKSRMSRANKST